MNVDKIKYLKNAEILDLSYNKINDISSISFLPSCKVVDLSFNPVENIRFIEEN